MESMSPSLDRRVGFNDDSSLNDSRNAFINARHSVREIIDAAHRHSIHFCSVHATSSGAFMPEACFIDVNAQLRNRRYGVLAGAASQSSGDRRREPRLPDQVRDLRNAIEHYHVDLTLKQTKNIGQLTAFVYCFGIEQLNCDVGTKFSEPVFVRFFDLKALAIG